MYDPRKEQFWYVLPKKIRFCYTVFYIYVLLTFSLKFYNSVMLNASNKHFYVKYSSVLAQYYKNYLNFSLVYPYTMYVHTTTFYFDVILCYHLKDRERVTAIGNSNIE